MLTVRPKIAELSFHLYGRSIHPELFDACVSRLIERENYSLNLNITSDGHLIEFRHESITLAEVSAGAQHPLPTKRQLISHSMDALRTDQTLYRDRVHYECEFQMENVAPKTFLAISQQLNKDNECEGLVHRFQSSGRMAFGAMSYINVQAYRRYVQLKSFHTFPDTCAIVKSQSTFKLIDPADLPKS